MESSDFSRWFAESIKDDVLVEEAKRIEKLDDPTPAETKKLILEAIQSDYTLPSTPLAALPGAS